jgi:hypothetical protein
LIFSDEEEEMTVRKELQERSEGRALENDEVVE